MRHGKDLINVSDIFYKCLPRKSAWSQGVSKLKGSLNDWMTC